MKKYQVLDKIINVLMPTLIVTKIENSLISFQKCERALQYARISNDLTTRLKR